MCFIFIGTYLVMCFSDAFIWSQDINSLENTVVAGFNATWWGLSHD